MNHESLSECGRVPVSFSMSSPFFYDSSLIICRSRYDAVLTVESLEHGKDGESNLGDFRSVAFSTRRTAVVKRHF